MKVTINNLSVLLVVIFILTSFLVITIGPAFAIETGLEATADKAGFNTDNTVKTPTEIIANIVQIALDFIGILFLILIIVSGFQWMASGGNSETISKAKKRIINATIGLVIVLSAYALTTFVIIKLVVEL